MLWLWLLSSGRTLLSRCCSCWIASATSTTNRPRVSTVRLRLPVRVLSVRGLIPYIPGRDCFGAFPPTTSGTNDSFEFSLPFTSHEKKEHDMILKGAPNFFLSKSPNVLECGRQAGTRYRAGFFCLWEISYSPPSPPPPLCLPCPSHTHR